MSHQSPSSIWLLLARFLQVGIICLSIGLFIVSIPINYEQRIVVCKIDPCPPNQLTMASVKALNEVGLSENSFATTTVAFEILMAATYTICAIVIFVRKPNDMLTIFVTVMLVTFGTATFAGAIRGVAISYPELDWLVKTIEILGSMAIHAFFFVFPNGRFTPRWTASILIGWFLLQVPHFYFPDTPLNLQHYPVIYNVLLFIVHLSGPLAQIYRYIHVSTAIERQQTKWVIWGVTLGMSGYLLTRLLGLLLSDPMGSEILISLGLVVVSTLFALLMPVSISIAVIRFRLWDINPIINRTLVYGALSASTIALYIIAVGLFSNYFQNSQVNFIVSFIATGVVAILFEPLRERLQRNVNRLMYGERDDPSTVLMQLSTRLDSALAPESVLQTIVETLAHTLRLPYAAISLFSTDAEPRIIAVTAPPQGMFSDSLQSEMLHFPLSYQNEHVGELILSPRAAGDPFSTADMNLVTIIAKQAGIAVHNLRLTNDLQRSREKLVTAQEEERRRLRRDLHDGIGPTLASFSQRLDTAVRVAYSNIDASVEIMKELKGEVKSTVSEIRRVVYALRPPVLDEFGLVTAIREHVAPYTGPNGLQIALDVTEPMPLLPAAVEVAAYRIALEAFTNIVNHAQATSCHIQLNVHNNSLWLEISDNGKGITSRNHVGVGLASMRERAAELGGEYTIENIPSGGTRVCARLPIGKD